MMVLQTARNRIVLKNSEVRNYRSTQMKRGEKCNRLKVLNAISVFLTKGRGQKTTQYHDVNTALKRFICTTVQKIPGGKKKTPKTGFLVENLDFGQYKKNKQSNMVISRILTGKLQNTKIHQYQIPGIISYVLVFE